MSKLTPAKRLLFETLAAKVARNVQAYWDEHKLPLGYRFAVPNVIHQLSSTDRQDFQQYLELSPLVSIKRQAKTASKYCFPALEKNKIDDEIVQNCMHAIERERISNSNRSRGHSTSKTLAKEDDSA